MTEVEIEVRHKIEVDGCIAKEVEELNNLYGVTTLWSCCGHGDVKRAAIVVIKEDVDTVVHELGYEQIMADPDVDITTMDLWVRPKSKCGCCQQEKERS